MIGSQDSAPDRADTAHPESLSAVARDPDEQALADLYAGFDLKNLDRAYEEVRFTFQNQAKRIDSITARSTWVVATAAGVVLAVVSQGENVAKLEPDALSVWVLMSGAALVVGAALLGLAAAGLRAYQDGLRIRQLRQKYLDWDPSLARVAWLTTWQEMFDLNEGILRRRVRLLRMAFALLVAGSLTDVCAGIVIVARSLR